MTDRMRSVAYRRRRRLIVEASVLLVGLCLLAWAFDALARSGAESLLARNLQESTGVAERPQVHLDGGFFLPQVIRGAYAGADVELEGYRTGPLKIARIEAHLSDVRLPLQDLLLRDIRRVGIGRSVDEVTLRFDDLNAYFAATGRQLQLSADADGAVQLTGSFDVLGDTVPVTAKVGLSVDGTLLRITPQQVDLGDAALSRAGRVLLDQRVVLTVPLDGLPLGSRLTGLTVTPDHLRISAEAAAVVLRP